MAIGPKKLLSLARGDFARQEKYSASLQTSAQFIFALGTGFATASVSMFRPELVSNLNFIALVFWSFAAVLWLNLLIVAYLLGRALWVKKMADPRTMEAYLEWRAKRQRELEQWKADAGQHAGAANESPHETATTEMVQMMTRAYADAACVNRQVNLTRQKYISRATAMLLIAAFFLGGQAVGGGWFAYNTLNHGRNSIQGAETRVAKASAPSTTGSSGHR